MVTDLPPSLIKQFEGNCIILRKALHVLANQEQFTHLNLKVNLIDENAVSNNLMGCCSSKGKHLNCSDCYQICETCNDLKKVDHCFCKDLSHYPKYYKREICRNADKIKYMPCHNQPEGVEEIHPCRCLKTIVHNNIDKGTRKKKFDCSKNYLGSKCIDMSRNRNERRNIEKYDYSLSTNCNPSMIQCRQTKKNIFCCHCKLKNHNKGKDIPCRNKFCKVKMGHSHFCCNNCGCDFCKSEAREKYLLCTISDTSDLKEPYGCEPSQFIDKYCCCHDILDRELKVNKGCQEKRINECKFLEVCGQCKANVDNFDREVSVDKVKEDECPEPVCNCLCTKYSESTTCKIEEPSQRCFCCSKLKNLIIKEKIENIIDADGKNNNKFQNCGESCFSALNEIKQLLLEQKCNQEVTKHSQTKELSPEVIFERNEYLEQLEKWGNRCNRMLREAIEKVGKTKCLCVDGKKPDL